MKTFRWTLPDPKLSPVEKAAHRRDHLRRKYVRYNPKKPQFTSTRPELSPLTTQGKLVRALDHQRTVTHSHLLQIGLSILWLGFGLFLMWGKWDSFIWLHYTVRQMNPQTLPPFDSQQVYYAGQTVLPFIMILIAAYAILSSLVQYITSRRELARLHQDIKAYEVYETA